MGDLGKFSEGGTRIKTLEPRVQKQEMRNTLRSRRLLLEKILCASVSQCLCVENGGGVTNCNCRVD